MQRLLMGHTRAHIRPFGGRHPLRTNCVRPCWSGAPPRGHGGHRRRGVALVRSFEADDVSKELNEQAALDELIDVLLSAKSQQELAKAVADNIFSFDNKFWLRVASRNDSASSPADKERLQALANSVMVLVDAMVKDTEQQLGNSARTLQEVLTAAADENGEWYLPLTNEQVVRVRAALEKHAGQLDEAMLSNAFAWIKKCSEDRFDSMVQLIQKILQLYAAQQLRGPEREGVDGLVNEVVYAEESDWATLIRESVTAGNVSEVAFMESLQKKMEATVLGLASGSYAQRVQAEYLKELEARARSVFKELAATSGTPPSAG